MNIFNKSSLTIISGFLIIIFVTYYLASNYGDINKYQNISSSKNTNYEKSEKSSPELQIAYTYKKIYEMKEGETFSQILRKTQLNDNEIQKIIKLTEEKIDLNKLNIGVKIETLSTLENDKPYVKNIIIYPDKENEIFIFRNNNNFEIKSNKLKLFADLVYREVDIQNSIQYKKLSNHLPLKMFFKKINSWHQKS